MANNTFEIIGKLMIGKESESFKPYKVDTYQTGWVSNRLLFNVIAGDNRHMLESKGGYFKDGNGKVFTFAKGGKDSDGNKVKGEKLEIPWKDRFKLENIEKVAEFKKFVVDLEEPGKRFKLEKALEKSKNDNLTSEELSELGVEDIVKACEDSKKKRKEFIAEADFSEYLYKLISSGKINERLFKVIGNFIYSEYNGNYYRRLSPTRIYLAEKDAVPYSYGQIILFYNKNSLDNSLLKKTNKYYINGFVRDYDNQRKTNIPCPVTLTIDTSKDETDEKAKIINNLFVDQFTVKDKSWKEFGVKVKLLDGSQKVEIADDILTDFQKQMLALGEITLDDIRKEMGEDIYGDPIKEMIIINAAKGYSKGSKNTKYVDSDFVIQELENTDKNTSETKENEEEDIFTDIDI